MIDLQTRTALTLRRTPAHRLLAFLHRKLSRYMDLAENWNNGDESINGEAWLVGHLARRWRLVFDVGANVGKWSQMLLAANPESVIYAFEPSPSTFQTLQATFQKEPRLKPYHLGLAEREGQFAFHDYGENSVLSSFVSRQKSTGLEPVRVIQTRLTTVDRFCENEQVTSVDFVKIDTEGYEMSVLRGMTGALNKRRVAMLQFEYGGTWLDTGETLAGANQLLSAHGYELYKLLPGSLERVRYDCRKYETFKYANFLALGSHDLVQRWDIPVDG